MCFVRIEGGNYKPKPPLFDLRCGKKGVEVDYTLARFLANLASVEELVDEIKVLS